jgi:hypothetical protein
LQQASAYDAIANYTPASSVTAHANIALDVADADSYAGDFNWTQVINWYTKGGNSVKGTGYRTVQGMAQKDYCAAGEKEGCTLAMILNSSTATDDLISLSLGITTGVDGMGYGFFDFAQLTDVEIDQISIKLMAYSATWLYSLHELYSALGKCESSDDAVYGTDDYISGNAPHAWDEGWAFWAGTDQTAGESDGYLSYTLAEKRCGDYSTCGSAGDSSTGTALVNSNLLALYQLGLDQIISGDCSGAAATKDSMVPQMTIPLIQGTLKYLYKKDIQYGNASGTSSGKEWAEAYAFAISALPMVYNCSPPVAMAMINASGMDTVMDGVFGDLKTSIESTYSCMGITCNDVGAYGSYWSICSDDSTAATVYTYTATPSPTACGDTPSPTVTSPAPTITASPTGHSYRRLTVECVSAAARSSFSTTVLVLGAMAFVASAKYL